MSAPMDDSRSEPPDPATVSHLLVHEFDAWSLPDTRFTTMGGCWCRADLVADSTE